MRYTNRPLLFVEDDEDDIFIIRSTLERAGISTNTNFVKNGQMAVEYIESCLADTFSANALPALIFLDINMPLMNGLEFLQWRREQPALHSIPVLMLTSSDSQHDITAAYEFGANAYLVKPVSSSELSSLLISAHEFWLTYNRYAM